MNLPKKYFDEKIVLRTKKPFNFYLTTIAIIGFVVLFATLSLIGRLDILGAFSCFIFFSIIVYVNTGRYLAEITLQRNEIVVCYCFPWNNSKSFKFERLIEIDSKQRPNFGSYDRWYSGFQWIYLKNNNNQTFQIRYNINTSDYEKLLFAIKKL